MKAGKQEAEGRPAHRCRPSRTITMQGFLHSALTVSCCGLSTCLRVFIVGLEEVGQHLAQWARSRCSDVSLIGIWSLLDHMCNTQCPLKSDGRLWPCISSVGISCWCLPFSWLACPCWVAITFPRNWSHHPLEYIFM